jgi:hypothetical protein
MTETAAQLTAQAERMKDAVRGLDPTLTGTVDTTLKRMREALDGLQGKIIQASKQKDDTLRPPVHAHAHACLPGRHAPGARPERGVLHESLRLTVVDRLLEALPLETDKHYVLTL